jgi:hypothetical protein
MDQIVRGKRDTRSGQAMLIAVLSLGGAILGATAVAGLLTLYQIRATTDSENSAKAIFAADAGIEWAQFDHYCQTDIDPSSGGASRCPDVPSVTPDYILPTFSGSGAAATVNCYKASDAQGQNTSTCSDVGILSVISSGIANNSERAFYIGFSNSTSAYP